MRSYRTTAALKSFWLASLAYLVVLAIGATVGRAMDDDSFAGLGLIAVSTVVLGPLAALVGAYIGLRRFGDPNRRRPGWVIILAVLAAVAVAMLIVEPPFQLMVPLLALTVAVVVRSGIGAEDEVPPSAGTKRPRSVPLP